MRIEAAKEKVLMDTIESTKDLSADNEKLLTTAVEAFKAAAVY